MNAFAGSLLASIGSGVIAAISASPATGSPFWRICFAFVGGLVGALIFGCASWIAVQTVSSEIPPGVWVRNTALGLAGLAVILSSPLITWFAATAVVGVLGQSFGGSGIVVSFAFLRISIDLWIPRSLLGVRLDGHLPGERSGKNQTHQRTLRRSFGPPRPHWLKQNGKIGILRDVKT